MSETDVHRPVKVVQFVLVMEEKKTATWTFKALESEKNKLLGELPAARYYHSTRRFETRPRSSSGLQRLFFTNAAAIARRFVDLASRALISESECKKNGATKHIAQVAKSWKKKWSFMETTGEVDGLVIMFVFAFQPGQNSTTLPDVKSGKVSTDDVDELLRDFATSGHRLCGTPAVAYWAWGPSDALSSLDCFLPIQN